MGNKPTTMNKVNFEDIQYILKNNLSYILINILPENEQSCLIKKTITIDNEETMINNNIKNKHMKIIIYGKNANDDKLIDKYNQLINLGFNHVYIYPGGLFEWLMLQDIYGYEQFPTSKKELDILKFKPKSILNNLLLGDID
tara:strand:- start:145 stop:570 length:426 start_codon:yes stop_codon:yes gene_type:complete